MISTINIPYTAHLELNVEDPSIVKTIKTLVRNMKGVMAVKEVKPRTKMTEQEFYSMIDKSVQTIRTDGENLKSPNESMEDYVSRLLRTV